MVFASNPSLADDWYLTAMGGGYWDQAYNWSDSAGNQPPEGQPGGGDSAFLVVPYWFNDYPNYVQPVQVFYRSDTNPLLNQVIVESGNELWQWQWSHNDLPTEGQLNLRSNVEIVGGSGLTFDPPPGYTPAEGLEVFPMGSHFQNAGTNSVAVSLFVGGTEGSQGLYHLEGTGVLSVGEFEYLGQAGTGRFEQNGGEHWVGTALFMGYEATGDGTYRITDGSLTVAGTEVVGSAGTGLFEHRGGINNAGQLLVGQGTGGSGTYQLGGFAELNVSGTTTVGNRGHGTFEQSAGTHNAGNLVIGAETGGGGTYDLWGGILDVAGNTQVGNLGEGTFSQTGGTYNAGNLTMAVQSGSSGTYNLGAGTLNVAETLAVGKRGAATFVQDGGTVNVGTVLQPGEMRIGDAGGATGVYTLNDGLLDVKGLSGIWEGSTFTQTGGEHRGTLLTVRTGATYTMEGGMLDLGQWNADGNVTQTSGDATVVTFTVGAHGYLVQAPSHYILENTDFSSPTNLTVNGLGIIGDQNEGIFTQRGGNSIATFENLTLGNNAKGDYVLEGGALNVHGQETIGVNAAGTFTQSWGINTVDADLVVGDSMTGTYELQGGMLRTVGNTIVGRLGSGTFNNSGGYHDVDGDLLLGTETLSRPDGIIILAGSGEYFLRAGATLDVGNNELIGVNGIGSRFIQFGGTHTIGGNLRIGPYSSFLHDRGSVDVTGNLSLVGARYTLSNDAELTVTGNVNVSAGNFDQFSGTHTVYGDAHLNGYNQRDGDFMIDGHLFSSDYTMRGGHLQAATHDVHFFEQSGGEHVVNGQMTVVGDATIGGTGSLTAGNVYNEGSFTLEGHGIVNAAGGIENYGGTFTVTGVGLKTINADLTNSGNARIDVLNTLAEFNGSILNDASTFSKGIFSINSSGVDFYGSVTNEIWFGPTWPDQYAELLIEDSVVVFHDTVTNYGKLQETNSMVHFDGDLHNYGNYITDPSDSYFSNLYIYEEGTIQAETGDRFFIEGDFMNGSLENILWDTSDASLIFNGTGIQHFSLAGMDMDATDLGYENNFSWGELFIGSGIDLTLLDGNMDEGAGLYIGLLGFEDPIIDIGELLMDSLFSDYNVYYDPLLTGNAYLGGQAYALNGSGYLMPTSSYTPPSEEPVPEPATILLLGSGLAGLAFYRRKRK